MGMWYLGIVGLAVIVIPLWRVCDRAGFNPALALLAFVPFAGVVIVGAVLAFGDWPALRKPVQD